jgi:hypothetical protein
LVDGHVGDPDHSDLPVGVRPVGCPVDDLHAIGGLGRTEELRLTGRSTGTGHIDRDADVAALDQVRIDGILE